MLKLDCSYHEQTIKQILKDFHVHTLIIRNCNQVHIHHTRSNIQHLILIGHHIHVNKDIHQHCKIYFLHEHDMRSDSYYDHSQLIAARPNRTYFH